MNGGRLALALGALAATPLSSAGAGKARLDPEKMLGALIACDTITDSARRLACFDEHVAEVKAARQSDPRLFRGSAGGKEEFSEVHSKLSSVVSLGANWLLVLEDHSVWQTADIIRFEPQRGDSVHIVKGALGGLLATIGDQRAVRIRRMH